MAKASIKLSSLNVSISGSVLKEIDSLIEMLTFAKKAKIFD